MAAAKNYYAILGLDKNATAKEIKSAYHRLAMQYHPDKNPGDKAAEEHFKEITEAYNVLSDERQRARYDLGGSDFNFNFNGTAGADFINDIFSQFFNGAKNARARGKPHDIKETVHITLENAALGATIKRTMRLEEPCATCQGTGAKPGTAPTICGACGGSGRIEVPRGLFSVSRECSYCHGRGRIVHEPCPTCLGRGVLAKDRTFNVTIPKGAASGTTVRFRGEGRIEPQGRGDLLFVIKVDKHKDFTREGNDIKYKLLISVPQAVLGTMREVPTLYGPVNMRIPAGTKSGTIMRLRNKGMPFINSDMVGDELVEIIVKIPTSLTPEQEALYKELARLDGEIVIPQERTVWDRMKAMFD
jgi:molecular chaperone DnaJ